MQIKNVIKIVIIVFTLFEKKVDIIYNMIPIERAKPIVIKNPRLNVLKIKIRKINSK